MARTEPPGDTLLMEYLFMELYLVDGNVRGQIIEPNVFENLKIMHGRCFKLPGKRITQFFVASDNALRSEDALKFIARIEKNRMVLRHIDLSQWDTTGTIKPCPPQKPQ